METLHNEQKKRIRYMYTWMFRRYRTNVIADSVSSSVRNDTITTDYLKMAQNNRMDKSIRFGWIGEAGSKIESGKVSKLYDINCFEQLGSELVTNGDFSNGTTGWAPSTNISVVNGELVYASPGQFTGVSQTITGLKIGSRYKLTGSLRRGTANTATIDIFGVSGTALNNNTTTPETKSVVFTATATSHVINLFTGDVTAGATMIYDNISLKEVLNATNTNNATQTTPGSRPYLTGNIAPNEKLGLKNPNGGSNFMTHPTISFAANESWSVTTVLNWNRSSNGTHTLINTATGQNQVELIDSGGSLNVGYYGNSTGWFGSSFYFNSNAFIGKTVVITMVKTESTISFYANGVLINQKASVNFPFLFSRVISILNPYHTFKSHIIRSQALTPTQVTAEYDYLRSVYPEIESVVIGTQTWATSNCEMAATPMGNVIAEMQAAANVEKITNIADREFSSDTGWWAKDTGVTIADGVCHFNNAANDKGINKLAFPEVNSIIGIFYKITVTVSNYTSGSLTVFITVNNSGVIINSNGTHTFIIKSEGRSLRVWASSNNTTLDIDNISVQEIGWSGSQQLYDGIYAQTAGTAEQKTYAAVKAAAMWCHYNNSVDNGAIYGKLYNWFAVKLLQMDIDYYNTANPTALWGWRVPTQADFQTLSTYLGGDAVSGGKLKLAGTTYWNSPNTGADNSSGFSALPSGARGFNGSFVQLKDFEYVQVITEVDTLNAKTNRLDYNNVGLSVVNYTHLKIDGSSLRLIKA